MTDPLRRLSPVIRLAPGAYGEFTGGHARATPVTIRGPVKGTATLALAWVNDRWFVGANIIGATTMEIRVMTARMASTIKVSGTLYQNMMPTKMSKKGRSSTRVTAATMRFLCWLKSTLLSTQILAPTRPIMP